jgi:hypothetical protein
LLENGMNASDRQIRHCRIWLVSIVHNILEWISDMACPS